MQKFNEMAGFIDWLLTLSPEDRAKVLATVEAMFCRHGRRACDPRECQCWEAGK